MKKDTILIVIISILVIALFCLGGFIILTPTKVIEPPKPVEITYPANEVMTTLDIRKPNTKRPRLMAIRNFAESTSRIVDAGIINAMSKMRYYIFDQNASDHVLFMPFETGGTMKVSKIVWNEYEEKYETAETPILEDLVEPGYCLLIKCDRTLKVPSLEVKLTQGEATATYWIQPLAEGEVMTPLELVAQDEVENLSEEPQTSTQTPDEGTGSTNNGNATF